jgi:hypothetical protein
MRISIVLLSFTVLGLAIRPAAAKDEPGGPNCCARCGRHVACVQKTCQLVSDVKKETKTCFCVTCEEFCPLLPGHRDRCDCCRPEPRCGHPKCVKKLVKKEYQVEVPIYKCVVVYLCPACANGESLAAPPAAAAKLQPLPPAPAPRSPRPAAKAK